jgi:hypothetical protein
MTFRDVGFPRTSRDFQKRQLDLKRIAARLNDKGESMEVTAVFALS